MAKRKTTAPARKAGKNREALERVMERALAIARRGDCSGWSDVLAKMSVADQAALRLWGGAQEKDAVDIACLKTRFKASRDKPRAT